MSHVSGGTPYSNNFVTEQYIGSNTVTPMSRVTQERHVTSPIQSKDQHGHILIICLLPFLIPLEFHWRVNTAATRVHLHLFHLKILD
jgi:hypothetical protein